MHFREQPTYSFDDVLLVPQHSEIPSRKNVDLSTKLGTLKLSLPLLSANMDSVTEAAMAIAMGKAGGAGVLHRFAPFDPDVINWVDACCDNPVITSMGIGDVDMSVDEICYLLEKHRLDAVCIDVAHGDHDRVVKAIEEVRTNFSRLDIIAGNVATGTAAHRLMRAGANIIKVGIGPGSVCSTRMVSGHGVPQLSAIMDVHETVGHCAHIIADGGIRYPGDIVKALAAGADAVMLGSLLAGTDEAAGERIVEHGVTYKTFRGMASREAQQKRTNSAPRVEGVSTKIPYRGPVGDTLDNLEAGIRSGLSYSGANNLFELRDGAEFVVVTGNTLKENHPHHPYRL
ncbi:MAG: IMP dehydrogenase [Candidatus Thorarchaeota archaeon]|jgi:IMP dehydrogenase